MRVLSTMLLSLIVLSGAYAQDATLRKEIENKYVVASDAEDLGQPEKGLASLHWLLKNAPEYSKSVQNMAIKAFEAVAIKTKDAKQKATLLDSMIIAYKSKEKHFGLSDLDKNKLAFRYFKYFRKDKTKLEPALKSFQDAFNTPEKVINNNLVPYMYMAQQFHKKVRPLSKEEVLKIYDQLDVIITNKRSAGVDAKRLDKYMADIDNILASTLKENISCDVVERLSKGLLRADSLKVSKRVMGLSLEAKCGRTPAYEDALQILARNEPTPGLLKIQAQYKASEKRYPEAIALYEQALELEIDDAKKANIHFDIAQIHFLNLNKPLARAAALAALELDKEKSATVYTFIGNLYMASFDECAESDNIVEDRAVFFAAYDMFEKAGDAKGKEDAKAQFPTQSEAFNQNMYAGDPITVECWINVKTKIRTRKSN